MDDEDDNGLVEDVANFRHFTGKQRLETAMNSLHGIVAGITSDQQVNLDELKALTMWLGRNAEFADRHPFNEVIPRIQQIISDNVVDAEERSDLLWLAERYASRNDYYDACTQDIQKLHGYLAGIVADGLISEGELQTLGEWVNEHEHLKTCWPYDELESIIAHVMQDGKIDAQEHEALMQFFGEFALSPSRQAVGALDRSCTVSGVCALAPEIAFAERAFCFTGSSKRATRKSLTELVRSLGGDFHNNLRNDTHFLIVGAAGNPCWAYACYGRKIEDAMERRRNGQRLLIVHELDFWDSVPGGAGAAG